MNNGYDRYKPIRNYIRKFNRTKLLRKLIVLCCKVSRSGPEVWARGYVPWELLLLAKWIIRDWQSIVGEKNVTDNELNLIINKVKAFVDIPDELLSQGDHGITKFMRRTAFQQFWHQKKLSASNAGRAIALLLEPNFSPQVEQVIAQKFGLARTEIIELMIMVWAGFVDENTVFVKGGYFSAINDFLPQEKVEKFINLFSLSVGDFVEFQNRIGHPRDYNLEVYEKTPFLLKPLLRDQNGDLYLWSLSLLNEIIEYGIYDLLKEACPEKFGDDFGPIFEKYLRSQLDEYGVPLIDESEQRRRGYGSQVDFIIEEESNVLLIEAKAIEASRTTLVDPNDEVMATHYRQNVVKGLAQANKVIASHQLSGTEKTCYLMVVTYKELFWGNGENVWDEFISRSLEEFYGISSYNISPENVFFVSVDSLDKLLVCSNGRVEKIFQILKTIVEMKKDIRQRRLVFSHYLEDFEEFNLAEMVDEVLSGKFNEYHKSIVEKYFPEHASKLSSNDEG